MQRECHLARWHHKRAPLGPLGSRRLLNPGVTLLVVTAFAGESTAESAPAAAEPQDPAAQNASAQLEVLRGSAAAGPPDATADAQFLHSSLLGPCVGGCQENSPDTLPTMRRRNDQSTDLHKWIRLDPVCHERVDPSNHRAVGGARHNHPVIVRAENQHQTRVTFTR